MRSFLGTIITIFQTPLLIHFNNENLKPHETFKIFK